MSYLRGDGNASERELEALAIYMGHSVAMQRDTYDRRTLGQKVQCGCAAVRDHQLACCGRLSGGLQSGMPSVLSPRYCQC